MGKHTSLLLVAIISNRSTIYRVIFCIHPVWCLASDILVHLSSTIFYRHSSSIAFFILNYIALGSYIRTFNTNMEAVARIIIESSAIFLCSVSYVQVQGELGDNYIYSRQTYIISFLMWSHYFYQHTSLYEPLFTNLISCKGIMSCSPCTSSDCVGNHSHCSSYYSDL